MNASQTANTQSDSISPEQKAFEAAVRRGLPSQIFSYRGGFFVVNPTTRVSPFHVKAHLKNSANEKWAFLVEFKTLHGDLVECELPWRVVSGKRNEAIAMLSDKGFFLSHDWVMKNVLNSISNWPVLDTAPQILLDNVGWSASQRVFALPDGEVFQTLSDRNTYRLAGKCSGERVGTLQDWRDGVANLCNGNPYLIFAVSSAFAAPLVNYTTLNTVVYHLHGMTSLGKTRALMAALSVWPREGRSLKTWTGTENGIEGEISRSNGLPYVLDELPREAPQELGNLIYRLANGTSKARAEKDGSAKTRAAWQTIVLSAGEYSVRSLLQKMGKPMTGGQGARMIDVPVEATFGVFDDLHGHQNSKSFVDALDKVLARASGSAGSYFVKRLLELRQESLEAHIHKELASEREKLTAALGIAGTEKANNATLRVLDSFALVSIAGRYASAMGLTGWNTDSVFDAVQKVAANWLKCQVSPDMDHAFIGKTRDMIEKNLSDFAPIIDGARSEIGYRDDLYFYVLPDMFAEIHGKSKDQLKRATGVLIEAGFLEPGGEKNSTQFKLPSSIPKRPRTYRISREILTSA